MGFRISYILADLPAFELADCMGLTVVETADQMPDDAPFWVARMNSGHSVLWCEDELFGYDRQGQLAALSKRGRVLNCIINETVMASTAMCYEDGASSWWVHWQGDGELTREQLTTNGHPPEMMESLCAEALAAHDDEFEDYFEVPVKLAEHLTGFRYDMFLRPEAVDAFHLLDMKKSRNSSSLFNRLFGGRA